MANNANAKSTVVQVAPCTKLIVLDGRQWLPLPQLASASEDATLLGCYVTNKEGTRPPTNIFTLHFYRKTPGNNR